MIRCQAKIMPFASNPMAWAEIFQQHATPELWSTFRSHPNLGELLDRFVQDGQSGWPQLKVAPEQFVCFLARHLSPESAEPRALSELRVRDLYLVCAFGQGDPAAQAALASQHMPKLRAVLLRAAIPDALITDIQQDLYTRLIEQQNPDNPKRGFSGRGDLFSWLCTCAMREARLRQKRLTREVALEQAADHTLQVTGPGKSPELNVLTGHLKAVFQQAFREAVAALDSRERNLLRYHFLAQLNIDEIGNIYKVHRATAARWVKDAQVRLAALTRKQFLVRMQVKADSLPEIMEQIQSLLSLSLGVILTEIIEGDRSRRRPSD